MYYAKLFDYYHQSPFWGISILCPLSDFSVDVKSKFVFERTKWLSFFLLTFWLNSEDIAKKGTHQCK